MIAFVSGKLVEKSPSRVVIDVHGVGLEIHVPASSYDPLPEIGEPATLVTYHHVREDTMQLFGFTTGGERKLFEVLLSVSGVGPRLALAALSALDARELQGCIVSGDSSMLTRIPGVGRRTAERLVVELRDKLGDIDIASSSSDHGRREGSARLDALAALESLGLSRVSAEERIRRTLKENPDLNTAEQLIKLALKD
ncbi:MAG: Holliday junction branch migration protein RuvA [Rhodothermia bacterium]